MRKTISVLLSSALIVQTVFVNGVLAAPAVTTANVNFRQGPGTGFGTLGTVPDGTQVELQNCDDSGAWCSISFNGQNGFVSGKYLQLAEAEETTGWPRSYRTDGGATLILYQPQFTEWKDFRTLSALVAAEYVKDKDAKPVFGVIGISGSTVADTENGEVDVSGIQVTQLDFSALDRTSLTDLSLQVGKIMPTGTITVKEDRVTAGLAEYQRMEDVQGLNAEAPPIFVSKEPAILVQTDGEPILAPVKGAEGLSFVVNTNWDILKIDETSEFYLRDEKSWLKTKDISSGWSPVTDLPDLIKTLPDDDNWSETREAIPAEPFQDNQPPRVIYSDKPAEMIVFEGEPKLESVEGIDLEWASNTDSDVFFLKTTSTWYILVSGRWFKSASLDGPWAFTTPDMPADFLNLPEDAPYYSVRASVPGTSEAEQARLKASIPTTARVEVGSLSADVSYAGDPEFEPIEGTALAYAVNTSDQVIQVGARYYVLQDGVWFVGDSPEGPFQVATAVPEEIYTIPPSSPVYNTTYVRIYETEPDAVWFGYTMGYLTGFLAWGTFVYGTGWYYRPWYRPGLRPIYFPRPVSYGIGAFYNPVRGTFGRYGYAYGPLRGIAGGGVYNPSTGGYIRGGAISGPRGTAGFISAYNPRTGNRVIVGGARGIYGSWGGKVVTGPEWSRMSAVQTEAAQRWKQDGNADRVDNLDRRGDVFAGQDGSVYRRDGEDWQKFEGGRWGDVAAPSRENLQNRSGQNLPNAGDRSNIQRGNRPTNLPAGERPNVQRPAQQPTAKKPAQRPQQQPAARPAQKQQPAARPAQRKQAPAHLSNDRQARSTGNSQVNRQRNVQQSRPQAHPKRPPGGAASRGGGGRLR